MVWLSLVYHWAHWVFGTLLGVAPAAVCVCVCGGVCVYSGGGGSGEGVPDEVAGYGQETGPAVNLGLSGHISASIFSSSSASQRLLEHSGRHTHSLRAVIPVSGHAGSVSLGTLSAFPHPSAHALHPILRNPLGSWLWDAMGGGR